MVGDSRRARLVRTPPSGSATARNRGVHEARAPIVLLLDDDCEPHPGWAAGLLAAVEEGADAAAGRGVNADKSDSFGEATQTVLDHLTLQSRRSDGTIGFAPTYNLAFRREIALETPFEEYYVNSGADRDWCKRLTERGRSIALVPEAIIDHRQTYDLRSFWRKHCDYGCGSARFHRKLDVGFEGPGFYVGLVREGFRRGVSVGLAVCFSQLATATGFAMETVTRRRTRRSAGGLEQ